MEGLIFGGVYQWREIYVSKSIGLALQLKVNLPFLLCVNWYLREIFQVQALGGLCLERRFNGGVFALPVWGTYIWTGLYMEGLIFGILWYFRCFFNHNSFVLKQDGHHSYPEHDDAHIDDND